MKTTTPTAILLALPLALLADPPGATAAERCLAQLALHVVTDSGQPVPRARIRATTFLRHLPGEGFGKDLQTESATVTDTAGCATLKIESVTGDIRFHVDPARGFYPTRNLRHRFDAARHGRWEPWNPTVEVVAKPILNPIPMYARRVGFVTRPLLLPGIGSPAGFDLALADWVSPHGRGSSPDLLFSVAHASEGATFTVSFPNPGDGIQPWISSPEQGSELHLPRLAPEEGYEPRLVRHIGRATDGSPIYPRSREDQNYFLRIRTALDPAGRVSRALHAKVVGEILCDLSDPRRPAIQFLYYLNPTSLDRNMEFDPSRNLFGDLPPNERVTRP